MARMRLGLFVRFKCGPLRWSWSPVVPREVAVSHSAVAQLASSGKCRFCVYFHLFRLVVRCSLQTLDGVVYYMSPCDLPLQSLDDIARYLQVKMNLQLIVNLEGMTQSGIAT